jgi:hypothetical protein
MEILKMLGVAPDDTFGYAHIRLDKRQPIERYRELRKVTIKSVTTVAWSNARIYSKITSVGRSTPAVLSPFLSSLNCVSWEKQERDMDERHAYFKTSLAVKWTD